VYPCDISRKKFEKIAPFLKSNKKKTKPIVTDLYKTFCGVMYLVKTGCQWGFLPKEYPPKSTVFEYFSLWSKPLDDSGITILDIVQTKLIENERERLGRNKHTTFLIVDAQSVKNTDTAKIKGYDGGKKVSGIKRHIAVDINGFTIAMHITPANIGDREGTVEMIKNAYEQNPKTFVRVINMCGDGGYTGERFANEIRKTIGCSVEIIKRNELHKFIVLPSRWIVERTFAWMQKCRRLWKNCEKTFKSSRAMMQLSVISLLLNRRKEV